MRPDLMDRFQQGDRSVLPDAHRGRPLEPAVRERLEPHLGHDFARVRIHTDDRAAATARAVGARAFTVGRDILFDTGRYAPSTERGRSLLAHELVHFVQQSRAAEARGATYEQAEAEARAGADAVRSKRAFSTKLRTPVRIARQNAGAASTTEADEPAELPEPPTREPVWTFPPGLRAGSRPVYDDETGVVIAYRYSSSGYWEIYDLEGRLIEVGEKPLETPLIDPIDILAGGITGLARGIFGSVGRTATRAAARAATGVAAGAGALRTAAGALGRAALATARATWRAIRFRGALNFTATTARHMGEAGRHVPVHILRLAVRWGTRTADPQGAAGAFRYAIRMFKGARDAAGNWVYREYTLEVVLREADQTILHFLYRP